MQLALALSSLYKVLRVGKLLDLNIQQALFDLGLDMGMYLNMASRLETFAPSFVGICICIDFMVVVKLLMLPLLLLQVLKVN